MPENLRDALKIALETIFITDKPHLVALVLPENLV